jgi:hypothetical protein
VYVRDPILAAVRLKVVERRKVHGRQLWRAGDGLWRLEGFPDLACSLVRAETIAALALESLAIANVNVRIVQLDGEPIPPRADRASAERGGAGARAASHELARGRAARGWS